VGKFVGKNSGGYCSFVYSVLACFRMGMSGSASFQRGAEAPWPLVHHGSDSCSRTTSESKWPRRTARLFPSGDRRNDQICSDLKSVIG
jgi:hypothetical protein